MESTSDNLPHPQEEKARRGWPFPLTLCLALLFASPMFLLFFVQVGSPGRLVFRIAHSHFGDQAHYMLMLSSLVEDGDLDTGNNYRNARERLTSSAGLYLRGADLDHHTILVNKRTGQKLLWNSVYHAFNLQRLSPENRYQPGDDVPFSHHYLYSSLPLEKLAALDISAFREVPIHAPGLPLLAAAFLFPFRHSPFIDTAALGLTVLVSLGGLYGLYLTVRHYAPGQAWLTVAVIAFATPLWLYSKTFFTEPYQAAFLIWAFYLVAVKKRDLAGGVFLGLSILTKMAFAPAVAVFCLYLLARREPGRLLRLCIGPAAAVAGMMAYHQWMMGSPFALTQSFILGNPLLGLAGLLFDVRYGLLPFSPVLILAVPGFACFFRQNRNDAALALALTLCFVAVSSFWKYWWGGAYSCRFLVPVLPLLGLPLAFCLKEWQGRRRIWIFYVLLAMSLIVSVPNTFDSVYCWGRPPWAVLRYIFTCR